MSQKTIINKEDALSKIKDIPIFKGLKDEAESLNILHNICKIRSYNKDEVIIKEGDIGSEMFIVYSGSVEIRKRTRAGDDYTVAKLKAEQNVFFGELALIDDDKRSATVIASSDSIFIVLSKNDFLEMGNTYPAISLPITRAIAKIIASRLRKTTQDMMTIFDALVNELHDA
ncbi:MAG: cyclic nucleotide-binding domain-containing protein [Spirochaetia bacterium]